MVLAVLALSIQADAMFKLKAKTKGRTHRAASTTDRVQIIHANQTQEYAKYQQPKVFNTKFLTSKSAQSSGGGPSFGLIALIAGVAAVVAAIFAPVVGLVFGAVAVVFGVLGLKQRDRNLAIAGLIVGIAAVVIALVLL